MQSFFLLPFSYNTIRVKLQGNQAMMIGELAVTDAVEKRGNTVACGRLEAHLPKKV